MDLSPSGRVTDSRAGAPVTIWLRVFVHDHGFRPLIPLRQCIPAEQAMDELYARVAALQQKRYVVERTIGWFKSFRRLR